MLFEISLIAVTQYSGIYFYYSMNKYYIDILSIDVLSILTSLFMDTLNE